MRNPAGRRAITRDAALAAASTRFGRNNLRRHPARLGWPAYPISDGDAGFMTGQVMEVAEVFL